MKKLFIILLFSILLIGVVSSQEQSLGVFKKDSTINLVQTCENSTYSNITRVTNQNEFLLNNQFIMSKLDNDYNLSFTNTSLLGKYLIYGHCDEDGVKTNWVYDLNVTPNGEEPNVAKAILNVVIFFVLVIFFIFSLVGIFFIDHYIGRFALYWTTHLLFIAVTFVGWTTSYVYLTDATFLSAFLKILFWLGLITIIPMVFLSIFWVVYIHIMTEEIVKMMEKGMSPEEAFKRKRSKGRFRI